MAGPGFGLEQCRRALFHQCLKVAPALFQFMMEAGPIELREAYATFNMGVGFTAYVSAASADQVLAVAKATGYDAWLAGHVRKDGTRKAVEVPSLGLTFDGSTLQVR